MTATTDATTGDGDGSAGDDRATVGVVGAGITALASNVTLSTPCSAR